MSEQLLTILKLCLLALLYLFFFRVLRAVWAELRAPAPAPAAPAPTPAAAPKPAPAAAPVAATKPAKSKGTPRELVVVEPATLAGRSFSIDDELTVGRATGCAISLSADTYVSSLHARVFRTAEGDVKVEDLGSTNGTYVNRAKVSNAVPLQRGDRLQVGNTALEAR
jgi:pSer/pThr/pTyr-binding forkhead associated (FHA) protein